MQASTTLRRSAISKRMVAAVIALAAAVALGGSAAFVAKSAVGVQQAPAVESGYGLPRTPLCDEQVCDISRFEEAPAAEIPYDPALYLVP